MRVYSRLACAPICYTLRRQDESASAVDRKAVLERDAYRCRACDAPGTGKRSITASRSVEDQSNDLVFAVGSHAIGVLFVTAKWIKLTFDIAKNSASQKGSNGLTAS